MEVKDILNSYVNYTPFVQKKFEGRTPLIGT